jgi:hypothetical protein
MSSNTDKLLSAFIEASGYEIEEESCQATETVSGALWGAIVIDYKVTKRKGVFKSKEERIYLLKKEIEELLKEDEEI